MNEPENQRASRSDRPHEGQSTLSPARRDQAVLITLGLMLFLCWGVILSGNLSGRGAADDLNYHWQAINQFAEQWPVPDLGDYASATTPGYHLLLAPLVKMGMGHLGAQLVASVWTLGLLGLLCWSLSRTLGRSAWVLMLPMLASMYVLFPGVWLLPDNAGWLLVLSIVLLCLRRSCGWGTWAIASVLLVALIWLRQVHIWTAAPIWLAAWLGNDSQTPRGLGQFFSNPAQRLGRTLIAIGLTIPAFMVLLWFMGTWGGLVPPSFQSMHQGPNTATPGFMLLQLSVLSIPFTPMLIGRLREIWGTHWRWLLLAGALGLLLGVVPESGYSYEAGRYGGWWSVIGKVPTIADRSALFVVLSFWGSLCLVAWLSLSSRRDVWVWIGVIVAFTLAQSANHASWQRYHEPMLLMMLLLIVARSPMLDRLKTQAIVGSVLLALLLGSVTAMTMVNAKPVVGAADSRATEPESDSAQKPASGSEAGQNLPDSP